MAECKVISSQNIISYVINALWKHMDFYYFKNVSLPPSDSF